VNTDAGKVLRDALSLPATDRAQLAAELLASLDDKEADVEAAWAAEIARRAAEARLNPDDDEDWREALAEVEQEVLSR
jgi:putative addiction module component (TIGR02574 family)